MGETVAYKGFVNEVRTYPRLSEEAAGIACHRLCFFRQDLTGYNKFKVPESHVLQCPRGADISGLSRINEHKGDTVLPKFHRSFSFPWVHGYILLKKLTPIKN
jgi:hypothetical protein